MIYNDRGYLLGAETPGEDDSMYSSQGIVQGHAYAIMDVAELSGGEDWIIQVQNPWGEKEWTGDWGDNSPLWTKAKVNECIKKQKDKGKLITMNAKEDGIF